MFVCPFRAFERAINEKKKKLNFFWRLAIDVSPGSSLTEEAPVVVAELVDVLLEDDDDDDDDDDDEDDAFKSCQNKCSEDD